MEEFSSASGAKRAVAVEGNPPCGGCKKKPTPLQVGEVCPLNHGYFIPDRDDDNLIHILQQPRQYRVSGGCWEPGFVIGDPVDGFVAFKSPMG